MNFKNYIHQIPGGALPPSPWPGGGSSPGAPPYSTPMLQSAACNKENKQQDEELYIRDEKRNRNVYTKGKVCCRDR